MSIGFNLSKVVAERFDAFEQLFDENQDDIIVDTALNTGFNPQTQELAFSIEVQFQQGKNVFIIAQLTHYYYFENELVNKLYLNQGSITLQKDFARHLIVLTIGSLRGYLIAKLEGTRLSLLHLPLIEIKKLLDEDLVVRIDSTTYEPN